jgi:hypothetical protein
MASVRSQSDTNSQSQQMRRIDDVLLEEQRVALFLEEPAQDGNILIQISEQLRSSEKHHHNMAEKLNKLTTSLRQHST